MKITWNNCFGVEPCFSMVILTDIFFEAAYEMWGHVIMCVCVLCHCTGTIYHTGDISMSKTMPSQA